MVLDRDREELEARIRKRVAVMIEAGLEGEVQSLLDRPLPPDTPVLKSVGYAETIRYLDGDLDRDAWVERMVINTRRYAKRQRTWFRGLENATWVPGPRRGAAGAHCGSGSPSSGGIVMKTRLTVIGILMLTLVGFGCSEDESPQPPIPADVLISDWEFTRGQHFFITDPDTQVSP